MPIGATCMNIWLYCHVTSGDFSRFPNMFLDISLIFLLSILQKGQLIVLGIDAFGTSWCFLAITWLVGLDRSVIVCRCTYWKKPRRRRNWNKKPSYPVTHRLLVTPLKLVDALTRINDQQPITGKLLFFLGNSKKPS